MRILVVAATEREVAGVPSGRRGAHDIDVLITGVGMVATATYTARALAKGAYALALNFGVCGSFDAVLAPGTVVHVVRDRVSELGAEDGEHFLPIEDLGLGQTSEVINHAPPTLGALDKLPRVSAISVNTVHGAESSISAVRSRYTPDVESMEGAAFAFACAISHVPYAQIRAVSNIVERRNREAWRLDLAIKHLNEVALEILDQA
jgi:futalosine hydrolase